VPLILKLSFIRRPLYHWGIPGTYRGGDWIGHTARLDAFGKKNTLPVPRNEQHLLGSEPWNRSHCATYPIRALPSSTVILFLYSSYIYIYIYICLFIFIYTVSATARHWSFTLIHMNTVDTLRLDPD